MAVALPFVYYGGLGLLLLLALTATLDVVFPGELGKDLREDSEALVLALGLAAWIEFARPRLTGRRSQWPVTLLAAAVVLVAGGWMYLFPESLPDQVATLDEPVLALALLVPYVQLRRPVLPVVVAALPAAVVLVVVLAPTSALVTKAPELLGMLVLVQIGLDLVERRILQPGATSVRAVRWAWFALLLAAPLLLSYVLRDRFSGHIGEAVADLLQAQEAWVGVLLLQVYLAARLALRSRPGQTRVE